MSKTIDQKVVQMSFDNSDFEKNTRTSLGTIEKLKKALNFDGIAKGLSNFNNTANKVDMSKMSGALDTIKLKFSALEVMAVTALANITNSVVNTGKRIAKSLLIDPPRDGLREYELQINSVQTIMGNTGRSVGDVNAALDKLNDYADLTIYNFAEMTHNAGMFTAAGLGLEETMVAIKGVGNWAAFAGANTQQMANATYQLGQALGAGAIRLQDWMSIEKSAGMAGEKYKNAFIETAREMGTGVDEAMKKYGGFRDSLREGWLTTGVFLKTMKKFAADQSMTDAATKVKTFTQLIDTLKEAIGTGWGTTFRTVIGDFEEAKELFTGLSNVFSNIINKSSDARNQLLKEWKDLGGRKALIDSLTNAFNTIASIIIPIKQAFRDIFPKTTATRLVKITEGIRDFIYNLQLSEEQMSKVRSIFRGLFSIIDIIIQAFMGLVVSMKPLFPVVKDLLGVIGDWLSKVGDFITKIGLVIKQSRLFEVIFSSISNSILNFRDNIKNFLNTIINFWNSKFRELNLDIKIPKFEGIINLFEGFKNKILSIFNTIKEKISPIVNSVVNNISTMFSRLSFKDVLRTSGLGMILVFFATLKKEGNGLKQIVSIITNAVSDFMGGFKKITGTVDEIRGILGGIKETLKAYQNEINSKALMNISISIGILVASLMLLSTIDSDSLYNGISGITMLFTELSLFLLIYSKMSKDFKQLTSVSSSMILISVSILILSGALRNLASLDFDSIVKGLLGVSGLMLIVIGTMKILSSGNRTIIKGAGSMVILALAIKMLSKSVAILGAMDLASLTKGLLGVGTLLLELSIFSRLNNANGVGLKSSAGLILLALAIKSLSQSVSVFGEMDIETIKQGLISLGVILAQLAIFTKISSGSKGMLSLGAGLILVGVAIKSFANSTAFLGSLPIETIRNGLVALGISLSMLAIALNIMPKNMISIGLGLTAVSIAIKLLSESLSKLGSMSVAEVAKGLIALGIALGEIIIVMQLATGALAGAGAIVVMALAITLLVPAIAVLGLIPIENIGKALLALAGVFTVFGVAAAILTPLIPSMLALAGVLTLLGVAVAAFGVGILAIGAGITAFATGMASLASLGEVVHETFINMITTTLTGLSLAVPSFLNIINELFKGILQIVIDNAPLIVEALRVLLTAVLKLVEEVVPKIIDIVLKLLVKIIQKIGEYIKPIVNAVVDLITALIKGIADNIGKIVDAGVYLITKFIDGILSGISGLVRAGFTCIIKFVNSLADTIRTEGPRLKDAFKNLFGAILDFIGGDFVTDAVNSIGSAIQSILDKIVSFGASFFEAGKNLVKGLVDGISGAFGKVQKTVDSNKITLPDENKKSPKPRQSNNLQTKKSSSSKTRDDTRNYSSKNTTANKPAYKQAEDNGRKYAESVAKGVKKGTPEVEKSEKGLMDTLKDSWSNLNQDLFNDTKNHDESMKEEKKNYFADLGNIELGGNDQLDAISEEGLNNTKVANAKQSGERKKSKSSKKKDQEEEIKAEDQYWKSMLDILKKGADAEKYEHMKLKDFKKEIFEETKKLMEDYQKSYDDIVKKIVGGTDFLSEVKERSTKSGNQVRGELIKNTQEQARLSEEYYGYVSKIQEHVTNIGLDDTNFFSMLNDLGRSDIDTLEALAGASDTELLRMYGNYEKHYEAARKVADLKMAETKAATETKLGELLGITGIKLEELKQVWNGKWDGLDGYVKGKLTSIGSTLGSSIASGIEAQSKSQATTNAAGNMVETIKNAAISKAGISNNESSVFKAQVGKPIVNGISSGIKDNSNLATNEAENLNKGLISTFTAEKVHKDFEDVGKGQISDIQKGAESKEQDIKNSMNSIMDRLATELDNDINKKKFITVGENFALGLADGIKNKIQEIANAAADVVKEAIRAAEEAQDSHSPSKEMIKRGAWFSQGYAMGIEKDSRLADNSAKNMAKSVIDIMSESISKIPDILGEDIDMTPTITPVLDLSNVSSGAKKLNTMLSYNRAINLGNTISNERAAHMQDIVMPTQATNNVYQFTQNNYSPKALSRMDIYRQTKNQFSSFERMALV